MERSLKQQSSRAIRTMIDTCRNVSTVLPELLESATYDPGLPLDSLSALIDAGEAVFARDRLHSLSALADSEAGNSTNELLRTALLAGPFLSPQCRARVESRLQTLSPVG